MVSETKKFKIGDRVVRVEYDNSDDFKIGDVGAVVRKDPDGYWVKPDSAADENFNFEKYLAPAPAVAKWVPKVGDRVNVTRRAFKDVEASGTIVGEENESFEVEFLDGWAGDHNGSANDGRRNRWYYLPEDLKPAPAPASLTIEAGRYYKTRDGRKVGPLFRCCDFWTAGKNANGTPGHFTNAGISAFNGILPREESRRVYDLIAEWVDEPAVATAASNDNTTPTKFNVGDRVRGTINPIEYDVIKVHADGSVDVRPPGSWCQYYSQRAQDFEPINQATPLTPAIVALIENGQPKPATRPFVHATPAVAAKEAERMADKHKGQQFGVYVLTTTAQKAAPTYRHNWQTFAVMGDKIAAIKELRSITGLGLKATKDAVEWWLANDEPRSRVAA